MANNPLASRREARFQEIDNLGQIIQEQGIAQQKETEIQQQAETLQKATEIEQQLKDNLAQAQGQSVLLKEFEKTDQWLARSEKDQPQLSSRLTKLPALSEEETNLLSQLQLSLEQLLAISGQTPYLTPEDREVINQNFLTFPLSQKLALISSGLNGLGIDTYQKKEVTEEQKQHLLDFGCNKLKLTEEQAEQLKEVHPDSFKTFALTGQQKNILNSLAPLTREDKYSEESLALLKQLNLKPANQTFLVQEEIIPDPHTQFGKSKSSYLPLKEKFLQGEQRIIRAKAETRQKKLAEKKIKENKLSILRSLWKVANRERFVSSQSSRQRETIKSLNLKELVQEQINQALGNWRPTNQEEENLSETSISEPSQSTSSRYDDLLTGLNDEEAQRMKKKLAREAAQKKLQEQERLRRESKLSEKDRKLKEAEERRQQERELAEAEEKKREEARLAREKALQAEQDAYFSTKSKNIAERKKAIEATLENKKKENELEEQKKKDQIEKMEQENKEEQERLIKQSRLIEEEKQKKLAAIALEDEEERQLIEKKANEEKARIETEILEVKRKNEAELKKKENQLLKERETRAEEIRKMEADKLLAEKAEVENQALYEKEKASRQALETQRANTLKITAERMDSQRRSEALKDNNAETALRRSHFDTCPTVEDGFNRYSSLQVNPSLFQFDSGKWNQQANLAVGSANKEEISKLEGELRHYQTLYQKRMEKDIDNETIIKENQQTKELFSQKIKDLETSLINLAKQKIKGGKDAEKLLSDLEKLSSLQTENEQQKETIRQLRTDLFIIRRLKQQETERKSDLTMELEQVEEQLTQLQEKNQELEQELKEYQNHTEKDKEEAKREPIQPPYLSHLINQLNRGKNYFSVVSYLTGQEVSEKEVEGLVSNLNSPLPKIEAPQIQPIELNPKKNIEEDGENREATEEKNKDMEVESEKRLNEVDKERVREIRASYFSQQFYKKLFFGSGELDLSEFINLEEVKADEQKITSLNVKNCFKLKKLDISRNELTSLDLSNNNQLVIRNYDISQIGNAEYHKFMCEENPDLFPDTHSLDNLSNKIIARNLIIANRLADGVDKEYENWITSLGNQAGQCMAMNPKKGFTKTHYQEAVNEALSGDKSLLQKLTDLPYISQ
ncbi:2464_t:CDS:10 [Funneliformis geosporum]|nr:2464_t:CDS:10 [Funneliformis geosporum]